MNARTKLLVLIAFLVIPVVLFATPSEAALPQATTIRVSVASDGTEGTNDSSGASLSGDGRYVGFQSAANNLVPDDTNISHDAFVHDLQTGQTERVSISSSGEEADETSGGATLAADGRYVTFQSEATNLVGGDTNGTTDIFVRDLESGVTERVSVASDGTQGNYGSVSSEISADGRYVAFTSYATTLVPNDVNGYTPDIFVHDRLTGATTLVSVASDGTQANDAAERPAISADGRWVAFRSEADNLVPDDTNGWMDTFLHDRETGQTTRVSVNSDGTQGDGPSYSPALSADGRYVAFESEASNLVPNDTNNRCGELGDPLYNCPDIFVHDRLTGETTRVSVASDGSEAIGGAGGVGFPPAISADGRFVAFWSGSSNLVPDDTNEAADVFLHDRLLGTTELVSFGLGWGAGRPKFLLSRHRPQRRRAACRLLLLGNQPRTRRH